MDESINLIKDSSINLDFNIVLTGFMGCGKTSVGKFLAPKIGFKVFDTDLYIKNETGLTVSNIFKIYGEKHFRVLEKVCIKFLLSCQASIPSCHLAQMCFCSSFSEKPKNCKAFLCLVLSSRSSNNQVKTDVLH